VILLNKKYGYGIVENSDFDVFRKAKFVLVWWKDLVSLGLARGVEREIPLEVMEKLYLFGIMYG
jgi:hypothetical protein